jgi:hypothetical protein
MRLAFTALAATGAVYFLTARRRVDLFSLAFLSSCIYFLPGFLGFTLVPTRDFAPPAATVLDPTTYAVFCCVLASVLGSGILFARLAPLHAAVRLRLPSARQVAIVSLCLGYVGFFAVLTHGRELMNLNKFVLIQSLDRWHSVLTTFATIGAVAAAINRSWRILGIALPLFGLDLFIGSRTTTAMAVMAVVLVWLSQRERSRMLLGERRLVLVALALAVVFFGWQQLFLPFKRGDLSDLLQRSIRPETYRVAVLNSEPFTIQAILNEVVRTGYTVDPEHLLEVTAVAVPFYTEFFESPRSFNAYFQPDLFPGVRLAGMANNFWAEGLAIGGWAVFLGYVALYVVALAAGSFGLRSRSPHILAISATLGAYLAFYIHRNDLLFELLLIRRFFACYVAALTLAFLLTRVRKRETLAGPAESHPG